MPNSQAPMGRSAAGAPERASSRPPALTRRTLLSGATAVAAAMVGAPLLSACSSKTSTSTRGSVATGSTLKELLPAYVPSKLVTPDVPGTNGSSPGFTKLPDPLAVSVSGKPGRGGTYQAMTPIWGTVPKKNNAYYKAIDAAIGATVKFDPLDGTTYQEKIGAVLASSDIPDVMTIPGWNMQGQIRSAIEHRFADLGPYLSGDAVKKYPNLANIPTGAWQMSIFGGKLRGLPNSGPVLGNAIFYRKDLTDRFGVAVPATADELLSFGKEVTDAKHKRWAYDDLWVCLQKIYGVLPDAPHYWQLEDGKLVHKIETQEYREALAFARKLHDQGLVHPDADAGKDGDAKIRFTSGQTVVYQDGTGGWYGMVSDQAKQNPAFEMQALDYFAADGGKPLLWQDDQAGIFTFLNKNLPKEKIEELLAIADYAAAPFGTKEYQLVNYGVQGVHYNLQNGTPVFTQQGVQEAQPATFYFLAAPPPAIAHPDQPQMVKDYTAWLARQAAYLKKPLFYGMQVVEPTRFATLYTPFDDLQKDIRRGRKPVGAIEDAVSTWKKNGGDQLRAFYQDILDKNGSGT